MTAPRRPRCHDEQGIAMLAAVMCVFIVTVLGAYALNSSMGSIFATGQNRKSLQAIDAAEAGVQDEVGNIDAAVKSGATTFKCPYGKQQVTLSNTGLADTANTASYTLRVKTGTTMPTSATTCPASGTLAVPSGVWDALVQAVGNTGAVIGGGSRTVAGQVAVSYQTVTKAQAESGQISLGGSPLLSIPNPAVTATNSGSSSSVVAGPSTASPPLSGETWLTAGALADYAEADWNGTSGTSYACSGLLSSTGAAIKIGSPATSCTTSGNTGTGGVGIDLSNIPELGTTLSSILDLKLTMDAATAYATETTNGVPSGSASILNAKLTINLVGGLLNVTVPVSIPAGPDQNVLAAITTAVTNEKNSLGIFNLATPILTTVINLLNGTVASLVTLNSDEWQPSTSPSAGSQLSVSALYLSVLPGAGSGLLSASLGTAIVGGDTGTQVATLQSLNQSS